MENQITDYLNILYKSTLLINILIFSQGKWFAGKLEKNRDAVHEYRCKANGGN